jgi:hypothetical protein
LIENVGHPARHPGGEVPSGLAQDHDPASGHVFAAMIADALDHGVNTAVANAEAFTRDSVNIGFAAGGSVEGDVADDYILFRFEGCAWGRVDNDLAA